MTDFHIVFPADDLHYLPTGRILHSPNPRSSSFTQTPSHHHHLGNGSFPRSFDDLDVDDGGAEIPDIPLRRSNMAKGEMDTATLTPLAQILAGNRDVVARRPINPNDIQRSGQKP